MTRIAIIGAGGIAERHTRTLCRIEDVQIVTVCDTDAARAQALVARHGLDARVCTDLDVALDPGRVEAAWLLTPRWVRRPAVECCIERKLSLFMEKPPCHDLDTGRTIQAAIERAALIHSVGFFTRYDEALNLVRDRLADERLSLINVVLQSPMASRPVIEHYPDGYLVERTGALVGDQGIHYIDIARYLTGSEIRRIAALGGNQHLPRSSRVTSCDVAGWVLEMQNGVFVTHSHTWGARDWACSIQLISDHSSVIVDSTRNRARGILAGQAFEFVPEHADAERSFELENRALLAAHRSGDMSFVRSPYRDALQTFVATEQVMHAVGDLAAGSRPDPAPTPPCH